MHYAKHLLTAVMASLFLGPLLGCVSLAFTFGKDPEIDSKVYIGTRMGASMLASPFTSDMDSGGKGMVIGAAPFILIDLPLSFAMDTILLPYTITYTAPKHAIFTYGNDVVLEGKLTMFPGYGSMLHISPSIYILNGAQSTPNIKSQPRVHIVQLIVNENKMAEFKNFTANSKFGQHIVVKGALMPAPKSGYVSLNVTSFQYAP